MPVQALPRDRPAPARQDIAGRTGRPRFGARRASGRDGAGRRSSGGIGRLELRRSLGRGTGRLQARASARPRRNRHGLPGEASAAGRAGRRQGFQRLVGAVERGEPAAVHPRGARGRKSGAPEPRRPAQCGPRRRVLLPGPALHRGRNAEVPDRGRSPTGRGVRRPHAAPDRRRPVRRACARDHPQGRQARQHHPRHVGRGCADRFRPGARRRMVRHLERNRDGRNAVLHVPRTVRRAGGGCAGRPLFARRERLSRRDRATAVHRRDAGGRDPWSHAGNSALAAGPGAGAFRGAWRRRL